MSFHGTLKVKVFEAKHLPFNKPKDGNNSPCVSCFRGSKVEDNSDYGPYVKISVDGVELGRTKICNLLEERGACWDEVITADVAHDAKYLTFEVIGDLTLRNKKMGSLSLSTEDMMKHPDNVQKWRILNIEKMNLQDSGLQDPRLWPLYVGDDKESERKLKLDISFTVASPGEDEFLKDIYFPSRPGNSILLYQDAFTPHMPLFDQITNSDGKSYEGRNYWVDMQDSLLKAQKIIYIAGWAFWPDNYLVRDQNSPNLTLGEILKKKAEEGVQVLLILWDEKTSNKVLPGFIGGIYDEKTKKYFKKTKVNYAYCYRRDDSVGKVKNHLCQQMFTHHEKTVIIDTEHAKDKTKRGLVAFVGGIDLTEGRYDDYNHELFSTLRGVHENDFHQGIVDTSRKYGPRMPWHDTACKIQGPTAYDLMTHFIERWLQQAPKQLKGKIVKLDQEEFDFLGPATSINDQWHCQVIRSVTEDSCKFDHNRKDYLTKKKGTLTDTSILRMHCHQIRRAKKFIYLETQFFFGSCYAWEHNSDIGCIHPVPMEIVNRIIKAIEAKKPFFVYMVIPLYPEADPKGKPAQEALRWQYNTIQMMYKRIAKAIKENSSSAHPTDYLRYYCLGKREAKEPDLERPKSGTIAETLREKRRFMVYVHSKIMITDDTHIIIGSANIIERSMAGDRDLDLAVGAYQQNYTCTDRGDLPNGVVSQFRKALWAEHTKTVCDEFNDPSNPDCVRQIDAIAAQNWRIYMAKETEDTQGFLMHYPYDVKEDGTIAAVEGCSEFPDTKGSVFGQTSAIIPKLMST